VSLIVGSRLGPYEILSPLGAGGMGEVYRARDGKLNREVAIKVLPEAVAADPERLARFQREAQVLAALNHPHIAAIYGLEKSGDVEALVLELVGGETLAERIAAGPIPLDEALGIARQIADALEAAHEKGIVHRDLKPANVKVTSEGEVKVLDFGLAKALTGDRSSPDVTHSPTLTAAATQAGVVIGTAAYMSPEQARGKSVDKRADIWAFGTVVYEMLTGRRAFEGEGISDVLAAVLRQEVDWTGLPAGTPPRLRRLLERCLDRDVKERLRDIGEARVEIAKIQSGAPDTVSGPIPAAAGRHAGWRDRVAWIGLAAIAAIALALGVQHFQRSDPAAFGNRVVRLPFVPPDGVAADEGVFDYAIVSPDGQKLLFTGRSAGGRRLLWLRPLDSMDARPLPGTDDAIEPFWSPDSRSVGFGSQGKLKRVDLTGGQAQTLADAPRVNGGAWGRSGVILFSPDFNSGLFRIPATGGEAILVSRPDPARGEAAHNLPCFLPDGRRFLYRVATGSGGPPRLFAGSLDSKKVNQLLADAAPAAYAPPGWLLYVRHGVLVAHEFDAGDLELAGDPIPVSTGMASDASFSSGRFSVSENGVLILQNPRAYDYQLVWFDRAGNRVGSVGPPTKATNGQSPQLSPDGKRVVIQRADLETRNQDIWVIHLARETFNRLTTDPAFDQLPVWSPDGNSVIVSRRGMYRVAASGGGEQLLLQGTVFPKDLSPDGRLLFYVQRGEKTRADLWALPLFGERPPYPLLQSEFDENQPQVSPDGRWLAYNSDVTGRQEIHVRPMTAEGKLGEATHISTGGGLHPRWRPDGRELFYIAAPLSTSDGQMMAVAVKTSGPTFDFGAATALFKTHMLPNVPTFEYDVTSDGQLFLVGTVVGKANATAVSIVLNWTADLKR